MKALFTLLLIYSCSTEPIPCKNFCGKIIETRHFREQQTINYTYISECSLDTIHREIKLNQEQLSDDNGISFYVNTFKVGEKYCEK